MNSLTCEEQFLIDCFTGASNTEIIADMENILQYLDGDMKALTLQTINKLKNTAKEGGE